MDTDVLIKHVDHQKINVQMI